MAIYYLDVDDEITGAVARLRASADFRVALVLPAGSRVATSRINFKLLAREAQEHERRLAVLSPESSVRAIAEAAGLVAYPTVAAYEEALDDEAAVSGLPVVGREPGGWPVGPGAIPGIDAPDLRGAGVRETHGRGLRDAPAVAELDGDLHGTRETREARALTDVRSAASPPPTPASSRGRAKPPSGVSGRSAGALPTAAPRSRAKKPRRSRRRIAVFVVGLLVILAGTAYGGSIVLPTADIIVTPVAEAVGPVSLTVTADPSASAVDAAAGIVPARRVDVPLEVSAEFPATGVRVDETSAAGAVRFASNNPLDPVTIPAGTTVATGDGVQFQVVATVVTPKATISGTTITAGLVDARIQAVNAGPSGNVAAHAIRLVPQRLANFLVSVDNAAATSGGTHTETTLVAKKDYDAALKALTVRLDAGIVPAVSDPGIVPEGATVFPDTATRTKSTANPVSADIVGSELDTFRLTLTATASVTAVDESQLAPLAAQRLRDRVPAGYELFPDSIHTQVGDGQVDGARVTFTIQVVGEQWRPLQANALLAAVKGKPISEAKAALALFGDVKITHWPDFVDTIPSLDERITISVAPPRRTGQ
jgi:hypothetical protein